MKILSALSTLFAASVLTGSALACHGGPGKAQFDANQDGKVSLAEALDGAKQRFERQDEDKNGSVSKEEARGPARHRFELVDTNKDGKLTLAEVQTAVRTWFGEADKNKDGFLSGDEKPGRGRHGKGHRGEGAGRAA